MRLEAAIHKAANAGTLVFGVCGGYQMLGRTVSDPEQVELQALLKSSAWVCWKWIRFSLGKKYRPKRPCVLWNQRNVVRLKRNGYSGYEIHMGRSEEEMPALTGADNVYGSYVHGIFDASGISDTILKAICVKRESILTLWRLSISVNIKSVNMIYWQML